MTLQNTKQTHDQEIIQELLFNLNLNGSKFKDEIYNINWISFTYHNAI